MRIPLRPTRGLDVRRAALGLLLGWLALFPVFPVAAAETHEDELLRWVPSVGVFFDMLGQKASGSIATGNVMGPPLGQGGCTIVTNFGTTQNGTLCPMSPSLIAPATASNDTSVAPMVGGTLELMTPRLLDVLFSPRLFVHVDGIAAFGFERNLAGERKPGDFFTDPLDQNENDIQERAVGGQGSRAKIQVGSFVLSAGGGVALTTKIFERTVRFKPSFEYLREEMQLIASVHRAVKLQQPSTDLSGFRTLELKDSTTEILHGLGIGLEIEADSGHLGPFGLSLFIMGRGYHFTGNLNHTLIDTNQYGETASWHFHLEPWAWRTGVGLRFRWLPD